MNISLSLYIFNYILFLILGLWFFPVYNGRSIQEPIIKNSSKRLRQLYLYSIVLFLLSVFGYSDWDFTSYYLIFSEYGYNNDGGIEPIYGYLITKSHNYFIWRAIIWGVSLVLMMKTIIRLPLKSSSTFFFLTVFYVLSFYKLRNTLGFSILYYGLSLFAYPKSTHKLLEKIWGLVLMMATFIFHKSMPITLLFAISGIIFNLNRTRLNLLILLWPGCLVITSIVINYIGGGNLGPGLDQLDANSKAMRYAGGEASNANSNGLIKLFIEHSAYLSCLFYITYKIIYKTVFVPKYIKIFYNIWFYISYAGYLLLFQETSKWLSIRILTMGYFPMIVVLGWYFGYHKRNNLQRFIIVLSYLSYLFSITYILYKAL